MDMRQTALPEVKVFTPRRFGDDRGYFMETYAANKYAPHLGDLAFVQDNESFSANAFTVRGLHYQAPPHAQDKLVRVVRGRALDVVVDIRRRSPTYARWVAVELTAERGEQILAPKGFLHGFMTLVPDTLVAYKVTDFYNAAADGAVRWNSAVLGINWPAGPTEATLSAKDAEAPEFDAFDSPFD